MNDVKVVVKVGGSLFDWPVLGQRLVLWLKTLAPMRVLLVPGGGPIVDVVRDLDQCLSLGEEVAHWLALRGLTLNAHLLEAMLSRQTNPRPIIIGNLPEAEKAWDQSRLAILDALSFAQEDENRPGRLPHAWSVTSDSLAARVAVQFKVRKLVLLKSTDIPNDWTKADRGIVDSYFEAIIRGADSHESGLEVSALNFRKWRG